MLAISAPLHTYISLVFITCVWLLDWKLMAFQNTCRGVQGLDEQRNCSCFKGEFSPTRLIWIGTWVQDVHHILGIVICPPSNRHRSGKPRQKNSRSCSECDETHGLSCFSLMFFPYVYPRVFCPGCQTNPSVSRCPIDGMLWKTSTIGLSCELRLSLWKLGWLHNKNNCVYECIHIYIYVIIYT